MLIHTERVVSTGFYYGTLRIGKQYRIPGSHFISPSPNLHLNRILSLSGWAHWAVHVSPRAGEFKKSINSKPTRKRASLTRFRCWVGPEIAVLRQGWWWKFRGAWKYLNTWDLSTGVSSSVGPGWDLLSGLLRTPWVMQWTVNLENYVRNMSWSNWERIHTWWKGGQARFCCKGPAKERRASKARWRAEARSCSQKNLLLKSWSCCPKGSDRELFVGQLESGEMAVVTN